MKLFKITFPFTLIFVLSIIGFVFLKRPINTFHPISQKNNFYQQLTLAINTSQLKTSSFEVKDFNHQVEFYVTDDNQLVKIILSDKKDPFWQITSLQEVLKTARINQQQLKLVDLSPAHPYATFKNN